MADESKTRMTSPGWYPDPEMVGTQRYWDGERWTEHAAPLTPPPAQSAAPSSGPGALTIARGVALGIAAVIAALFFLGQCSAEERERDCVFENLDRAVDGQPALPCP